MKIDLLVISGRTLDTEPCVLIQCENQYYVFNFPEQTQRVFMEYKWKMKNMKQIFLTDTASSSIGGIPGMILTTLTDEKSPLGFTGPDNFSEILSKQMLYRYLPDRFPEISTDEYKDQNITVTPIKLQSTIAYSVKLCDEPGKFNAEKAKALGLKPGPIFSKLKQGQTITLDDGRVIEPSMCVGQPIPGATILILDIKQEEELDSLFQYLKDNNQDLSKFDFIVHFTRPRVFDTEKYQQVFTEASSQHKTQTKQKQIQLSFHYSDKITFRNSYELYSSVTSKRLLLSSEIDNKDSIKLNDSFLEGELGLTYTITPSDKRKVSYTQSTPANKNKKSKKATESNDSLPFDFQLPQVESFGITFLGTGCNMPTKLRNVTGILIQCKEGFIILDAGEGFTGQMFRRFGRENGEEIIKNLLFIWNSHSHGDHVFGLHGILELHQKLSNKKISVFADQEIIDDLISRGNFNVEYKNRETKDYQTDSGNVVLNSFPVEHTEGSHGCVLTIDQKWRIAFSGDHSVVKDDFVEKVGKCDVLIHEATFSDDMEKEALEKNHSTIGQAIEAGQKLSAKFIILTHFSARYKLENCHVEGDNILFAFDFLSFTLENASSTCNECKKAFLDILKANEDDE